MEAVGTLLTWNINMRIKIQSARAQNSMRVILRKRFKPLKLN